MKSCIYATLASTGLLFACSVLSANTIVHWNFDTYGPGANNVASVTSNGVTLAQVVETSRPSATLVRPAAHSERSVSALFTSAQADYLASAAAVPQLSFGANTAFTIEGWFNMSSITDVHTIVSNRGSSAAGNAGFTVYVPVGDSKLQFQVDDGPNTRSVRTDFTISTDQWYFFAASRDTAGKLFLSVYDTSGLLGSWNSGTSFAASALATDNATVIGKNGHTNAGYFDGYISEIRISEGVLAPETLLWTTAIPEPAAAASMLGFGAIAAALCMRRR